MASCQLLPSDIETSPGDGDVVDVTITVWQEDVEVRYVSRVVLWGADS